MNASAFFLKGQWTIYPTNVDGDSMTMKIEEKSPKLIIGSYVLVSCLHVCARAQIGCISSCTCKHVKACMCVRQVNSQSIHSIQELDFLPN